MKRAGIIIIAALLVLLVYPSTHSLAKAPEVAPTDGGTGVVASTDYYPPRGDTPRDGNGGQDEGDSDDLAGYQNTLPTFVSNGLEDQALMLLRMWWNFMLLIR